jgi:hypothetical protein
MLGQKWIKCTANDITKCTNEEDYWLVHDYGQVRWCPKTWNGSTYVTGTCSTNTHVVAGGAPTLNFACTVPNLTAAGNLPPGTPVATGTSMTMASDTGVTSGTPNTAGTYNYTVQVEDSTGSIAQKTFQTVINPAGTCGPPTYPCSRTDLANACPFLPIPNVGGLTGFNTIVTPSGFNGNRVVRVTDTQCALRRNAQYQLVEYLRRLRREDQFNWNDSHAVHPSGRRLQFVPGGFQSLNHAGV